MPLDIISGKAAAKIVKSGDLPITFCKFSSGLRKKLLIISFLLHLARRKSNQTKGMIMKKVITRGFDFPGQIIIYLFLFTILMFYFTSHIYPAVNLEVKTNLPAQDDFAIPYQPGIDFESCPLNSVGSIQSIFPSSAMLFTIWTIFFMLPLRVNDLPKAKAFPSESRDMSGLMLNARATKPFRGLTRPPRTMYLSVFMSTKSFVLATHSSASRTICSCVFPS